MPWIPSSFNCALAASEVYRSSSKIVGNLNRPLRRFAKRRHNAVSSCGVPSSLLGRPTTSALGCHSFSKASILAKRVSVFSSLMVVNGLARRNKVLPTAMPMRLVPKSNASKVPDGTEAFTEQLQKYNSYASLGVRKKSQRRIFVYVS